MATLALTQKYLKLVLKTNCPTAYKMFDIKKTLRLLVVLQFIPKKIGLYLEKQIFDIKAMLEAQKNLGNIDLSLEQSIVKLILLPVQTFYIGNLI